MLPVWTPRAAAVGTCATSAAPLSRPTVRTDTLLMGTSPTPFSLSLSVSSSSSETVSGSFRHRQLSSWTGANGGRPWMPQLKVLQALRSEGRKTDWEICKGSVSFSIHLRSCALFISVSLSLSQSRASRNGSFFPYREFTQQKWEKMRHEDSTLRNKWTNNKRTKGGCWRHTLCCP